MLRYLRSIVFLLAILPAIWTIPICSDNANAPCSSINSPLFSRRASLESLKCIVQLSGGAGAKIDPPIAKQFDPERYTGVWYEVSKINRWFLGKLDFVSAEYTLKEGSKNVAINVFNAGTTYGGQRSSIKGVAQLMKTEDDEADFRLTLKIFGLFPVRSKYQVYDIDSKYRHAIVGNGKKNTLFILSRDPVISDKEHERLVDKAVSWGFDRDQITKTKQSNDVSDYWQLRDKDGDDGEN